MSSGYVTTNIGRKPDQVRTNKLSPVSVDLSAVNPLWKFSVNEFEFRNPITSFRSGPSFDRESRKPGAVYSEQNLGEVLATAQGDIGHEFAMQRVTRFCGNTFSRRPSATMSPNWGRLNGPFQSIFTDTTWFGINSNFWLDRLNFSSPVRYPFIKTDSDLVTLGTSFIKETNPIQSQVNLLSSIAEAIVDSALLPGLLGKEIFSSVVDPRKRGSLIRSLGGEYLNYIFGYKPLADDIAKLGVLIDTVNGIVDQWIKDSGTIVRRRRRTGGELKNDLSRTYGFDYPNCAGTTFWFSVPGRVYGETDGQFPGQPWQDSAQVKSNVALSGLMGCRVSSEITFSAGYTYDFASLRVPTGDNSAADLMHDAALREDLTAIALGLDPGSIATALYDATPFSWLLDWFVNIGDVLDNLRGLTSRGVQMTWGYITETAIRESYYEYSLKWTPTSDVFFRSYGFYDQKSVRRIRATPFGFGSSFGSLTSSQLSILGALAAAKSPSLGR